MSRYRERVFALKDVIRRHPGDRDDSFAESSRLSFPAYETGAFFSAHSDLLDWSKDVIAEARIWHPAPSGEPSLFAPSLFRYYSSGYFGTPEGSPAGIGNAHWLSLLLNLSFLTESIWLPDPTEMIARAHAAIPEGYWSQGMLNSGELSYFIFEALLVIERLQPLIDAGVVRLFPAFKLYEESVSPKLLGEVRSFSEAEMAASWPGGVVAEGLLFSSKLGASYAALADEELDAMLRLVGQTGAQIAGSTPYLSVQHPQWPFVCVTNESIEDVVRFRIESSALRILRQRLLSCGELLTRSESRGQAERELQLAFRDVQKDKWLRRLAKRQGHLFGTFLLGSLAAVPSLFPDFPPELNLLLAGSVAAATARLPQPPPSNMLSLNPSYFSLGAPRDLIGERWFSSQPAQMFKLWGHLSALRAESLAHRRRKPI